MIAPLLNNGYVPATLQEHRLQTTRVISSPVIRPPVETIYLLGMKTGIQLTQTAKVTWHATRHLERAIRGYRDIRELHLGQAYIPTDAIAGRVLAISSSSRSRTQDESAPDRLEIALYLSRVSIAHRIAIAPILQSHEFYPPSLPISLRSINSTASVGQRQFFIGGSPRWRCGIL
ncbi:hypothetical protein SISNIDRAFT_261232 [Sistotremastrum niveocremeum HHB9708]|uniref:Uncharacterized protein n=2 Tax=Sistotremastraceae TaxID=3402574 RepID=A0A164PA18_9AGAM|nr:hypothetical protein SISNIDRAFT_261232 [Sistotremastrum niveocremeum HHB9708]KZT34116.1 hypothetical protein SISSUDRAFT_314706 [Sistotremastrum suecicum HHB10207 ss-3]